MGIFDFLKNKPKKQSDGSANDSLSWDDRIDHDKYDTDQDDSDSNNSDDSGDWGDGDSSSD